MKMPTLKEQAEVLRLSLLIGMVPKQSIIAWADHVIESEENLPWEIIEISLAGKKSVGEIVLLLSDVGGEVNSFIVIQIIFGILGHALARQAQSAAMTAWLMYRLLTQYDLDLLEGWRLTRGLYFDDSFALAEAGIYDDTEKTTSELVTFLSTYLANGRAFLERTSFSSVESFLGIGREITWKCPAFGYEITERACSEYAWAGRGGPTDIIPWLTRSKQFIRLEYFHQVCDECEHGRRKEKLS